MSGPYDTFGNPKLRATKPSAEASTSKCTRCNTIDGCACPVTPKAKPIFRSRPLQERYDIIAFLRQGGEHVDGVWHAWDNEMAHYAIGFAVMIEAGRHRK